jgi:pimeloyl-ACP methyl ester carboxylesterase
MDALKLERPVIAGFSIAGEELSSIGSRHPERVAGLVYLDAGYAYAFYDSAKGFLVIDLIELRKKLDSMMPGAGGGDQQATIQELLNTLLPQFEKDLREQQKQMTATAPGAPQRKEEPVSPKVIADYVGTYTLGPGVLVAMTVKDGQLMTQLTGQDQFPMFAESDTRFFLKVVDAEVEFARDSDTHAVTQMTLYQNGRALAARKTSNEPPKAGDLGLSPQQTIQMAILAGEQKYTSIPCPVLAIYAVPHDTGSAGDPAARAAQDAQDLAETGAQADAFEKGVPSARVVRIAHASHAVFTSNETQVLQEMNAFMAKLPK